MLSNREHVETHGNTKLYIFKFLGIYLLSSLTRALQNRFKIFTPKYSFNTSDFNYEEIRNLLPNHQDIISINNKSLFINDYERNKSKNIMAISIDYKKHKIDAVIKFSKQLKPKINTLIHSANLGYCREALFYKNISKKLPIKTPKYLASYASRITGDYFVVLEKFSRGKIIADHDNCPVKEGCLVLNRAAKLHAHPLQELGSLEWIVGSTNDRPFRWLAIFYKKSFTPSYINLLNRLCDYINTLDPCLNHIDLRPGNICFEYDENGNVEDLILFDWAAPTITAGIYDVVYFMSFGISHETRKNNYTNLTDNYLSQLKSDGICYSRSKFDNDYLVASLLLITISYGYDKIKLFEDWNVSENQWNDWKIKLRHLRDELNLNTISKLIDIPEKNLHEITQEIA